MNALRRFGRRLLLGLVELVYPDPVAPPPAIDIAKIHRVLVVRTDPRVGNVLLTTPLVRALRRGLPWAQIDFLVAAGKEQLVAGLCDTLVVFDKKAFFRAPWRFWRMVLRLRRARYDLVLEAGHWHAFSFTSLWLTSLTGAPIRIGHDRGLSSRFLTHALARDPAVTREVPAKLELLRPLGIAAAGEELDTTVDRGLDLPWLNHLTGGRRFVALNPGARKPGHRWPARAFGQLAERLWGELDVIPLVLWGPAEEALAHEVAAASNGAARLAPPTDLAQLAAVFRRSQLVITNDTGPMHLAVAVGAPVLAILVVEGGERWAHAQRFTGVRGVSGAPEEIDRALTAARDALGQATSRTPTSKG